MTISKDDFLDIFPYFRTVDDTCVQGLLDVAKQASAPGKQTLKREGDKLEEFVLLLSGSKRVFKASESGREITLYEMGPGDMCVLNASCILSNITLPANAESLSDIEMLLIPDRYFMDLMSRYEQMQVFVFSRISQSLVNIMSLISEICFTRMDERLADYLIEKSENNILNTPHRIIANDLGTSREVVSRLLKDFERHGGVKISRNQIEIKVEFLETAILYKTKG